MSVIETGTPSMFCPGPAHPYYAVVAAVGNANRVGCVFTLLHCEGAPISTPNNYVFYEFPNGATNPSKPYITESLVTLGDYYICGSYNLLGVDELYVIKVSGGSGGINPALLWNNVYTSGSVFKPSGILESPHNPNDVVIVGTNVQTNNSRREDGFFLKLDNSTGATGGVLTFKVYGNTGTVVNEFHSLAPAFSPTPVIRPEGYVVGGKTMGTAGFTSWMLKLDQNGNIGWNRALQSSNSNNQAVTGVFERLNSASPPAYEYFGVTSSAAGSLIVFKLENNGLPNSFGDHEFEYAVPGGGTPAYITSLNSGSSFGDGIHVYGCDLTNNEVTAIKAYFNGESCSTTGQTLSMGTSDMSGPNSVLTPACSLTGQNLVICNDVAIDPIMRVAGNPLPPAMQGVVQCNTASILTGSNAKSSLITGVKGTSLTNTEFGVYPNPATDQINVTYNVSTTAQVSIELYNYMGQRIRSLKTMEAAPGSYKENISLSSLNVSSGVYFIKAKIGTSIYQQKIVIND